MLNKKAIAAFAAGATLLSGMAFAAPAFAADAPKGDQKAEECTPGTTAQVLAATVAVDKDAKFVDAKRDALREKKDDLRADQKVLAGKQRDFDKAVAHAAAKKADADKALTDYQKAVADYTKSGKDMTKVADDEAVKKAKKALDDANLAYYGKKSDNATTATSMDDVVASNAQGAAPAALVKYYQEAVKTYKEGDLAAAEQAVKDAQADLDAAEKDLKEDKAYLDKLQCKKSDDKDKDKDKDKVPALFNFPTDGFAPTNQSQAIDYVRLADMNLQNAENNKALKEKAYKDASAALKAAYAEAVARAKAVKAAELALNDFMATGANDSATLTRLQDALDRAQAHFDRATKALNDAQAKFEAARTDAFAAVRAYNHALSEYKRLYNAAIALGVNPALLPPVKTDDPLTPNFPDITAAKDLYTAATSGNFGEAVKKAVEKCGKTCGAVKKDAKKCADKAAPLAKTGAAVALAAVAASVLAGMGAALRKIRH